MANTDVDTLRRWGQILLWVSIILPSLGALAVAARYYVERHERRLTAARAEESIRTAREEAATAREAAASARDAAARAQSEQEHIRTALVKSNHALEDLRTKTAPRRLTPNQQKQMATVLKAHVKDIRVAIAYRMLDGESADFANEIGDALKNAGCGVPELIKTSMNDFPGYVVITGHGNSDPALIPLLQRAFEAAGIPVTTETVRENSVGVWYDDLVHVVVGRKAPITL